MLEKATRRMYVGLEERPHNLAVVVRMIETRYHCVASEVKAMATSTRRWWAYYCRSLWCVNDGGIVQVVVWVSKFAGALHLS